MLIKDKNGNNISVSSVNGYTAEKVLKAERYLKEIGSNQRSFPMERLVEMYNDIKGTKERAQGCKPCQATKFFNGIQNYAYYGRLTLQNRGIDLDAVVEETKDLSYKEQAEAIKEVDAPEENQKMSVKERLEKARAAKKAKKDAEDSDK